MPEAPLTPVAVGRAIRLRRLELGLTQEQLCERMGMPGERVSYISAVENGQRADLKITRLDLFAQALETSATDLLLVASKEGAA
ncbi:hypothetical protein RDMS_01805 [Deinococcus sp. RL]|uniref:helix-turn-helix domain-containing protein n=1 Tax=Deinococcus sp. RL TaxID=1489678 RepID=UPI0004D475FC|nr:helix-turn-helix transcriptional regulator [Deinococcus sp. RL]KEF35512.1 hypothetical protein RDMS_01805 [Deinococcus sp. RL]